jgi:hypothetical protein
MNDHPKPAEPAADEARAKLGLDRGDNEMAITPGVKKILRKHVERSSYKFEVE